MNKPQYFALLAALALFCILYLGFGTVPANQKIVEQSRSIQAIGVGLDALVEDARAHLDAGQSARLQKIEQEVASANTDADRADKLKQLSGWWYAEGHPEIAGGVAEQVAELDHTDEAWSVTGATFYGALVGQQNAKVREYCATRAINAFESAISLNPGKVEHRVNLALVYAENPSADDPMKAVTLLRSLEAEHPDNPAVYNALGRLAIKTGQWERAIARLEKARSLDPQNPNTACLLAKAYNGIGNSAKAAEFESLCGK